jgi:biopolymer transport protein ExbD
VINADRAASHGIVIGVLDAVRQVGLQRVSFQTTPEQP